MPAGEVTLYRQVAGEFGKPGSAIRRLFKQAGRGRARSFAGLAEPGHACLLDLFGGIQPDGDIPVAAIEAVGESRQSGGHWLRADPVILFPGLTELIMPDSFDPRLTPDEVQDLTPLLGELFPDRVIQAVESGHWRIQCGEPARIVTTPPSRAAGRDIRDHLPDGVDAGRWRALMNESQMLLHGHPLNEARADRQEPLVGSLWFWGSGTVPALPDKPWSRVFTDDSFTRGLAAIAGVPAEFLPADGDACVARLRELSTGGRYLVVQPGTAEWDNCPDRDRWIRHWYQPLREAVRTGVVTRLNLLVADRDRVTEYRLRTGWWKRWLVRGRV